jgi:hypothetical protein
VTARATGIGGFQHCTNFEVARRTLAEMATCVITDRQFFARERNENVVRRTTDVFGVRIGVSEDLVDFIWTLQAEIAVLMVRHWVSWTIPSAVPPRLEAIAATVESKGRRDFLCMLPSCCLAEAQSSRSIRYLPRPGARRAGPGRRRRPKGAKRL